jgi:hypothetical protein
MSLSSFSSLDSLPEDTVAAQHLDTTGGVRSWYDLACKQECEAGQISGLASSSLSRLCIVLKLLSLRAREKRAK